jgi:ankyrin repeat protein
MNNLDELLKIKDIENNNIFHLLTNENKENKINKILKKNHSNITQMIDSRNNEGDTPLHLAVKNNNNKLIGMFLNYGANKNVLNGLGEKIHIQKLIGGAKNSINLNNKKNIYYGKRYL